MKTGYCTKCGKNIEKYTLCDIHYKELQDSREKLGTTDYQCFVNIDATDEERKFYNIGELWDNSVECPHCHETIRSRNKHDLVRCSCGKCFVDGGSWYSRSSYDAISKVIPFKKVYEREKRQSNIHDNDSDEFAKYKFGASRGF